MTQAELADAIGVPLAVVERFEAGTMDARRHVEAIARATETPQSWLESGPGDDDFPDRYEELVRRVELLTSRVDDLERELAARGRGRGSLLGRFRAA